MKEKLIPNLENNFNTVPEIKKKGLGSIRNWKLKFTLRGHIDVKHANRTFNTWMDRYLKIMQNTLVIKFSCLYNAKLKIR